jgi:hypothetical protein
MVLQCCSSTVPELALFCIGCSGTVPELALFCISCSDTVPELALFCISCSGTVPELALFCIGASVDCGIVWNMEVTSTYQVDEECCLLGYDAVWLLITTNVSEERIASMIRVERISDLRTTLAVTSNSLSHC